MIEEELKQRTHRLSVRINAELEQTFSFVPSKEFQGCVPLRKADVANLKNDGIVVMILSESTSIK